MVEVRIRYKVVLRWVATHPYLSALANGAALAGKSTASMLWGVDDATHDVVGTTFRPGGTKVGNEELESWLLRLLEPKIHFRFHPVVVDGLTVVLLDIGRASGRPVRFQGHEFVSNHRSQHEARSRSVSTRGD